MAEINPPVEVIRPSELDRESDTTNNENSLQLLP